MRKLSPKMQETLALAPLDWQRLPMDRFRSIDALEQRDLVSIRWRKEGKGLLNGHYEWRKRPS